MKHLIDAHCLIWALDEPDRLSAPAVTVMQDPANELLISAGTVWELSIKTGLGKLTLSLSFRHWMDKAIGDLRLALLPITLDHAERLTSLPPHHRDPFDRLLVAQSLVEAIPLVSADVIFEQYGINRVWK
jgi:PIN domain nuclease of toxin-antitoxin system